MFTRTEHTANSQALLNLFRTVQLEQDQYDDMFKLDINQSTGEFFYDAWQLKPEYENTEVARVLSQLGSVGQAKIVSIPPGQCYLAHSDVEDRYHVTLQSDQCHVMDLSNQQQYPCVADNRVYHMDTARLHTVVNAGYLPRIQLVVRQLLTRPKLINPVHVHIEATEAPYNLRQLWDQYILVWCNLANKKGVMANFDPRDQEAELHFDLESTHVDSLRETLQVCGFGTELSTTKT